MMIYTFTNLWTERYYLVPAFQAFFLIDFEANPYIYIVLSLYMSILMINVYTYIRLCIL